jgi:hypothetical protein
VRWAFRVRGDLVFDDDSVVMLAELCARVSLAPLRFWSPCLVSEIEIALDDRRWR